MMNPANFEGTEGEIFKRKAEIVKLMGEKRKVVFDLITLFYIPEGQQNKEVTEEDIVTVDDDDTMEFGSQSSQKSTFPSSSQEKMKDKDTKMLEDEFSQSPSSSQSKMSDVETIGTKRKSRSSTPQLTTTTTTTSSSSSKSKKSKLNNTEKPDDEDLFTSIPSTHPPMEVEEEDIKQVRFRDPSEKVPRRSKPLLNKKSPQESSSTPINNKLQQRITELEREGERKDNQIQILEERVTSLKEMKENLQGEVKYLKSVIEQLLTAGKK